MNLNKIQEILDSTSLETSIMVSLTMADYDNWDNGTYKGNKKLIKEQVEGVLRIIEEWQSKNYINPIREKE
jgi:hypothetical protein